MSHGPVRPRGDARGRARRRPLAAGQRRPGREQRAAARRGLDCSARGTVRARLLDLDARDLVGVQRQIRVLLNPESAALRRYRGLYERSLSRSARPVDRADVVRAATAAAVVLVGDYHTLPEAQLAALQLALEIGRERPLVLGLEMVRREHQQVVDGYLEGRFGDTDFLAAIDYATHWPFPWGHYRPLLDAARRAGWPVLALDSAGGTAVRDRVAAQVLVGSLRERPDAVHLALVGDLHLAPEHLPRSITDADRRARIVVVHQNEPRIYQDLVERELDLGTSAVVMGPGRYCLLNATPLRRERSYLTWIENRWGDGRPPLVDPAAEFRATIDRLAEVLGIEAPAVEWEVVTGKGLAFLPELERRLVDRCRLARVRREITRGGRTLIGELELLYCARPTADDLAEAAMQAVQEELGEPPPVESMEAGAEGEIHLLAAVRREALAFMAACLLHPPRAASSGTAGTDGVPVGVERQATGPARELVARLRARVTGGRPFRLSHRLRGAAPADQWAVAHDVGRLLGRLLFVGLFDGTLEREPVLALLAPPPRRDRRTRERQAILELAALAMTVA